MEARRVATALVLFLCTAGVLWWAAASLDARSGVATYPPSNGAASSYMLVIQHHKEGGSHVYSGEVQTTGCDTLATGVQLQGEQVPRVAVTLTRIASTSCPTGAVQASTEEPFMVAIASPIGIPALHKVILDGTEATFTVIEK